MGHAHTFKVALARVRMIKRKGVSPLESPEKFYFKSSLKTPHWAFVGVGLIILMSVTYAQVAGVTHHPAEINWDQIISPLGAGADFLSAINVVSAAAANKTSGVNADALDGLDSTAFFASGGTSAGFYTRTCGYISGGVFASTAGGAIVSPASLPSSCLDASGSSSPPSCEVGDTDLGVDCYPTTFHTYDGDFFYVLAGECHRTCER